MTAANLQIQRLTSGHLPWHVHRQAYLAIVLDGRYQEAGDDGRFQIEAGDVVLHLPFERHGNRVDRGGGRVVNIALSASQAMGLRSGKSDDPEGLLIALAEGQPVQDVLGKALPPLVRLDAAADILALGLVPGNGVRLERVAVDQGISSRTLRRGFQAHYGLSPGQFRARCRARHAWRALMEGDRPLATIAHDLEFSDQAHMSRAIVALTGSPPSAWRRSLSI